MKVKKDIRITETVLKEEKNEEGLVLMDIKTNF